MLPYCGTYSHLLPPFLLPLDQLSFTIRLLLLLLLRTVCHLRHAHHWQVGMSTWHWLVWIVLVANEHGWVSGGVLLFELLCVGVFGKLQGASEDGLERALKWKECVWKTSNTLKNLHGLSSEKRKNWRRTHEGSTSWSMIWWEGPLMVNSQ